MVGKKISVKVTGDNESTATSAETAVVEAAATEKLQILSAAQKSGSEIEVKFNKAVSTADFTFEVKRGTTAQTVETAVAADGLTATLILGTKMGAAEYVITVTNKTDAEDTATYTLSAEVATLAELEFQGENLIQTSADQTSAAVVLLGKDQFGGDVVLTSSNLNLYSSVSTNVKYDNDTKRVIVEVPVANASLLAVGQQVTITAMYNSGTNYIQKAQTLTVASRAYVQELTFGELTTSKEALKDKRVTLDNFASNTYYLPVTGVKDQYGNAITAKELNKMIEGNLLFMVPNSSMDSYYAYTEAAPFDTLADGTTILNLKDGILNKPGTFQVSATSVGGGSFSTDVTLEDNPWIEQLGVTIPELYAGTPVEITVVATDQYGDPFDLYEAFGSNANQIKVASVDLYDLNNMTNTGSSIAVTGSGTLSYIKDSNKKTVKLTYSPVADDTNVVFTVTSAKPTVTTQTATVNAKGYAAGIKGLASTVNTSLSANATIDFTDLAKVIFLDSYGATMAKGDDFAPVYAASAENDDVVAAFKDVKKITGGGTDYTAGTSSKIVPDANAVQPNSYKAAFYTVTEADSTTDNFDESQGLYTANTDNSDTLTITLYPVKYTSSTNKWAWDTTVTKTVAITMTGADKLTYAIVVDKNKTLHVGEPSALVTAPSVTIKLKAYDSAKTEVALSDTNLLGKVTTDIGLVGATPSKNSTTISYDGSTKVTGSGTAKVTAYVSGVDDPVQCDLAYDDAKSVATKTWFQKYDLAADAWNDVVEDISAKTKKQYLYVNDKDKSADGNYSIGIEDQYGDAIFAATLTQIDNTVVKAGTTTIPAATKYRLAYGDKSQVVNVADITNGVALGGAWAVGGASEVTSDAELVTAIANTAGNGEADTIVIGATFAATNGLLKKVDASDTVVIAKGVKLTLAASDTPIQCTIENNGELALGDGTIAMEGNYIGSGEDILSMADTASNTLTIGATDKTTSIGEISFAATSNATLTFKTGTNSVKTITKGKAIEFKDGTNTVDEIATAATTVKFTAGTNYVKDMSTTTGTITVTAGTNTVDKLGAGGANTMAAGTLTITDTWTVPGTSFTISGGTVDLNGTFSADPNNKITIGAGKLDLAGATLVTGATTKLKIDGTTCGLVLPDKVTDYTTDTITITPTASTDKVVYSGANNTETTSSAAGGTTVTAIFSTTANTGAAWSLSAWS